MIINRIYENQNLMSLLLIYLPGRAKYLSTHPALISKALLFRIFGPHVQSINTSKIPSSTKIMPGGGE
jgi:hypothetical protein